MGLLSYMLPLSNLKVILMPILDHPPLVGLVGLASYASKQAGTHGPLADECVKGGQSCDIAHVIRPKRASCVHHYCTRTVFRAAVHCTLIAH